jgi:TP901 family phage tail tape measure protein
MSVSIGSVLGYLILDDQLSPALKIAQANISKTATSIKNLGGTLQEAGMALAPLSAGLIAAGAAAFTFGKDFEKSLTQISSLVGASTEELATYKEAVLSLSGDTARAPKELSEALYFITSSGQSGATALGTLEVSAKAAAIGLGETKVIADAATSAMNAYGQENLTSAEAVRVLIATVREGKGEADAIASSFGRIVPIAAEMGVRLQDLGAFMAATTKIGLSAEESATALRGALTTLASPTKDQTDAFADLAKRGLLPMAFSLEDVRKKIREEGLAEGFMQLTNATKGNIEALTAIIGNVRAATGVLGAYGKQGEETVRVQAKMRTDLDEINTAFGTVSGTVDFKWNRMLAEAERIAIKTFDTFRDKFATFVDGSKPVIKAADDMLDSFKQWPEDAQNAAVAVGAAFVAIPAALVGLGLAFKGAAVGIEGLGLVFGAGGIAAEAFGGTVMTMVAPALAIIGTSFAALKIGEWAKDLRLFGDEAMSLGESVEFGAVKFLDWIGVVDASDADIENAVMSHEKLAKAAAEAGDKIAKAAPAATEFAHAVDVQAVSAKNAAGATEDLGIQTLLLDNYYQDMAMSLEDIAKMQEEGMQTIKELSADTALERIRQSGTAGDYERAQIEATFKAEVAKINTLNPMYDRLYKALRESADVALKGVGDLWDTVKDKSVRSLQETAQKQRDLLDKMIFGGEQFNREVIQEQINKVHEAEDAARGLGAAYVASFAAAKTEADELLKKQEELARIEEQRIADLGKLRDAQGNVLANQTLVSDRYSTAQFVQTAAGLGHGLTGADLKTMVEQGMGSLEEIARAAAAAFASLAAGQSTSAAISLWTAMGGDLPDLARESVSSVTSPHSNVIAGAASAGMGTRDGGNVTMNNYINGTGEQVAKVVSGELMRVLKSGRQFGAV